MSRRRDLPPLSADRIGAEAVALLDEEGLEALSMRRLAERLGVEPSALYYHLPGKTQLIDTICEAITAELPQPPEAPDWRAHLRATGAAWRAGLARHPAALSLLAARQIRGRAWQAHCERAAAPLRRAGVSPDDAGLTVRTLATFVLGHAHHIATADGHAPDPDRLFDFGLDALIAGLEARAGAKG